MSMTDPIADMLTRIRNGVQARHESVEMPSSKMKVAIARVLKDEGFVKNYQVLEKGAFKVLRIDLSYAGRKEPVLTGIKRVSKPGLRVYTGYAEIPRVYGGLGVAVISTPAGVMSGQQARRQKVGGEVICHVW
ncbi:MAG: 30S ribosomal protein S8 [Chloroflexi bacterium]|nr:30S ribosomal protein S8 [Chloroflexota bacterium]